MLPGKEIFLVFIGSFLLQLPRANTKNMYALCPPDFFGIGTECYYVSQNKVNWLDAHFDCRDLNGSGSYNWAKKKWQWQDGKEFMYQSFSQMPGGPQELLYHCAILNPNLKYRWSASLCVEKHQYICQHRMPYVNEKHRSRIYARWNQTYPNEYATEVEVVLNDADMLKRVHRQSIPTNGRSTNTQRLSRHRNYLANEWLKKYRTQQIVVRRNQVPNDITYINTQDRNVSQRPNKLPPRRRNPSIGRELGREDFLQFERRKNANSGALFTNKVDDFENREPVTKAPNLGSYDVPFRHPNRQEDVTSAPRHQSRNEDVTSTSSYQNQDERLISVPRRQHRVQPRRRQKIRNEIEDLKEKKRLDETRTLLETGRYEHAYTRRRTSSTTTSPTTTTEANVVDDNERIELERNRELENRRRQEEEAQRRLEQEERIRTTTEANVVDDNERIELERNRELENRRRQEEEAQQRLEHEERIRRRQQEEAEERRRHEERLQNQIDEETLRIQHEEELRRLRHQEDEQRRIEEEQRIQDEHVRDREEKMRLRELELKQREEEEEKIRKDEERRQEENRKQLEEIERQQREDEEKQRKEAENKRIEEENRRRRKEELKNKQKMKENQVSQSNEEDQLTDLREDSRLKEKLRREKLARLKERIKNLSPEAQLKFFEMRGLRFKKQSDGKENETATNQL